MPAGEKTCNARRTIVDSYCQLPGVAPFKRCKVHNQRGMPEVLEIFKRTVPMEQALQLEALMQDTLSMDNELASAKNLLVQELNNYHRANYVATEYMNNVPELPKYDDMMDSKLKESEMKVYSDAVKLHGIILDNAMSMKYSSFKNAQSLIKILSDGVAKNAKIKEGSKFTLDVKQVSKILKVQLEAHLVCKECPRLKDVLRYMREHTKDIPLDPQISQKNRNAIGKRGYQELMEEVVKRADQMKSKPVETKAEILDDDDEIIID